MALVVHEVAHLAESPNRPNTLDGLFDEVAERELRADDVELKILHDWLEERLAIDDVSTATDIRDVRLLTTR